MYNSSNCICLEHDPIEHICSRKALLTELPFVRRQKSRPSCEYMINPVVRVLWSIRYKSAPYCFQHQTATGRPSFICHQGRRQESCGQGRQKGRTLATSSNLRPNESATNRRKEKQTLPVPEPPRRQLGEAVMQSLLCAVLGVI